MPTHARTPFLLLPISIASLVESAWSVRPSRKRHFRHAKGRLEVEGIRILGVHGLPVQYSSCLALAFMCCKAHAFISLCQSRT